MRHWFSEEQMFRFQVHLDAGKPTDRWEDVRPTGGQPYEYPTREEAEKNAYICYGKDPSIVRVVEVKKG
jgi:hypothetical protein